MIRQNRLLVFGASACGKTLLCHEVLRRCPGVVYVSASAILKSILSADVEMGEPNTKETQLILCQHIRDICDNTPAYDVLIDGHLYLPSNGDSVPAAAISSLELTAFLQVNETAETVSQRRHHLQKKRKTIQESHEDIENEAESAKRLSASLGIPIIQINPPLSAGISTVISYLTAR